MMVEKMWFGNRNLMRWIEAPQVGDDLVRMGSGPSFKYLNGGAFRKITKSAAKSYTFSWGLTSRDNIRAVTDYSDGVYGDGPYYWTDPFAMDKNVLPQSFATPSVGGYDGPILSGGNRRPELVPTSANSFLQPSQSVVYTLSGNSQLRVWIPIPPGFDLIIGASGSSGTGGAVYVQPTNGPTATGTATALTLLSPTGSARTNHRVSAGANVTGVEVYLGGTGTIALTSMMAQIVPSAAPFYSGEFISGQGHSGCEFDGHPTVEMYSAALDLVGASANLIEVGQWR